MTQLRKLIMLLCLVAAAVAGPSATRAAQGDSLPGRETLATLRRTVVPSADPVDLARRLRGVTDVPPNPTQPLKVYKVGDIETFWASDADSETDFQVRCKLLYATAHVYMWFEAAVNAPAISDIKRSADKFENSIYPTARSYFGSENTPGVDGDVHLYVVHARKLGGNIAGYFSSSSEVPKVVSPHSNQAQMFYVNLDNAQVGTDDYEGTLAHEFQHMIHDHEDTNEETWLNEGLSELSRLVNGYADTGFAPYFLANPDYQLNAWPEAEDEKGAHYGASYLFATYFLERFGKDAVRALVAEPENGLTGIEAALRKINAIDSATGKPITFIDLFADWQLANLLNNKTAGDGRYAYTLYQEKLRPITLTAQPANGERQGDVNQYGTRYLAFTKPGKYTLDFQANRTVPVVPAKPHSGQYVWWSNRADKSDTTLTRAFDLTGVKAATLQYWTWFDLEGNWDYAYLIVSEDGGQTWTPLATPHTTTEDPHANAYGPGYTGQQRWFQEKVDLSAYAGKQIQVRFEMITDDAVNNPGLLIDDVELPELGYQSDFEADGGGWEANGFVRMDNTLPQEFLVQELRDSGNGAVEISWLLAPDGGTSAQWSFEVGGAIKRVVLTLSGATEFTTQPAPYTLTIKPN